MSDRNPVSLSIKAVRERTVLRNVYLWMAIGLALIGVVPLGFASTPQLVLALVKNQILFFGILIGEFALAFFLSSKIIT